LIVTPGVFVGTIIEEIIFLPSSRLPVTAVTIICRAYPALVIQHFSPLIMLMEIGEGTSEIQRLVISRLIGC